MNLLIDTHALIWFLNGDKQISDNAKAGIKSTTRIEDELYDQFTSEQKDVDDCRGGI